MLSSANHSTRKLLSLVFFLSVSFLFSQSSSHDGSSSTAYAIPTNANLEISGDVTLEAWLRPNAPQSNIGNVLMKGSYGYSFGIMNDGTIAFWQTNLQNSGPESTTSIVQDGSTWTHVAVVNEGGVGTTFYINGVSVGSNATGGSFQVRTGDLYIGRQGECNCNFFNGLIDELRVWNDVRTAGEILANYNQTVSGSEPGLAAYYRWNEGSGSTILDEVTATSYTPSVNAITWDAENALNPALTFDGTGYVNIGSPLGSTDQSYTKEAWIYTPGSGNILSSNNDPFWFSGTAVLSAGNGGSYTQVSSSGFPTNTWTHAAVTYDQPNSTMRLFVNGVQVDENTSASAFSGGLTGIGAHVTASLFNGQMDEVRIWDVARTPSQILLYYDQELNGSEPNLVDYYKMEDGSGLTLTDLADEAFGKTSNDGTIVSGVTFNTTGPQLSGAIPCTDPTITETITDNTSCSAGNGELTVLPSTAGGEPAGNYTVTIYRTSDVTMTAIASGSSVDNVTGLTANNLIADTYSVEVTNNDTGCSITQQFVVNDNTVNPTINTATVVIQFESIGGANDGSLDATGAAENGTGPYTYNWYSDPGLTTLLASNVSISGLAAGTYYLEVVDDASDCISLSESFTVLVAPQNALNFDGTNDHVTLSREEISGTGVTYEAWVRTNASVGPSSYTGGSGMTIIGDVNNNVGFSFGITNGLLEMHHFDGGSWGVLQGTTLINDDNWHHVAVTHEQSTGEVNLYIDGMPEATSTITWASNPTYHSYNRIGSGYNSGTVDGDFFDGEIDEVRIWNVARTATEILGNLTTIINSATNLVSYYDFNNTGNTALADEAGSNDGALINFALSGGVSNWVASTLPSCAPNGKFIGATDSDWSDPSNWCGGVVPTSSNVSEDVVVSIDSDITETEDLVLNANDFQVAEGTNLTLDLNSNALQLTNGATFTNNGTVFFEAGTNVTDVAENFINNGTIRGFFTFDNNFTNPIQGTVAPGASPGCANFTADFTNSGILDIEVDGLTPCSEHDQITVGGTANLGGTLNVTLGYTPVNGDQIIIIDAATISGTFTTENLPDANWSVAYNSPSPGQVSLNYVNPNQTIGFDGPGGVGNADGTSDLTLWFKADEGVFSDAGVTPAIDNDPVGQWNDASGYSTSASSGASPIYQVGGQNNQPNVNFDGVSQRLDFDDSNLQSGSSPRSVFMVMEYPSFPGSQEYAFSYGSNVSTQRYSIGVDPTGGINIENNGGGAVNQTGITSNATPFIFSTTYNGGNLSNSTIFIDGVSQSVTAQNTQTVNTTLSSGSIGSILNGGGLNYNGDVYEVIFFNTNLNQASQTIVENYLSAKYAIDITNDLYAGDTAPNGDYDFDVAGIGNESGGSDPTATASSLILENGGFLSDIGDYLFAGHDGTAQGTVQSDLPGGYTNRWARDWYLDYQDVGSNGGLVTLTFDYAEAGLSVPSANLALITRASGTGAYSVAATNAVVSGSEVSFTVDVSSLIDGHRYTIADDFVPNNSLSFDGSDDYVEIPDDNTLTFGDGATDTPLTFELWINPAQLGVQQELIHKQAGGGVREYSVQILNTDEIEFTLWDQSSTGFIRAISTGLSLATSTWSHLAFTYDGSSVATGMRIFQNGEEIGTTPTTTSYTAMENLSTNLRLGSDLVGDYFMGEFDEVRIWNVERTQEQIVADAYTSLNAGPGLVASYDFNQGTAGGDNSGVTTLIDRTTNGNDGTLNGPFALNFATSNWVTSTAFDSDVFAPIFLSGYPQIDNFTTTGFDITVQLNEPGTYYYVVVADGSSVPTVPQVTGATAPGQVDAGNVVVTSASTDFSQNITGLAEGTNYDLYIVAQDDEGSPNVQNNNLFFDVSTVAPSVSYSAPIDITSGVTFDGTPFNLGGQDPAPLDIAFSADGLKMFMLGDNANRVYQYSLTTPFETTSGVTYDAVTFNVTEESIPQSIDFSFDGTKMFVVGRGTGGGKVHQYDLSTPFDISAVTFEATHVVNSEESSPSGLTFSPDGLTMYVVGFAGNEVNQYSLTNPYDISTGVTFDGTPFSISAEETNATDLAFGPDGTKLFVLGSTGDDVNQYTMTVPFDVTGGGTFDGTPFNIAAQEISPQGIAFGSNGTKMYVIGNDSDVVNQYSLSDGFAYREAPANDGSVLGSMIVTVRDETFTSDANVQSNLSIGNLPGGLSPVVSLSVGNTIATITLTGNSGSHADVNDVGNLQFTFTNGAFSGGNAAGVLGATAEDIALGVDFNDPPPAAPTDLRAYASSPTNVLLLWTDNATDETGYRTENADDYAFTTNVQTAGVLGANTNNQNVPELANSRKFYRVQPTNGNENASSFSSVEFATTVPFPASALEFDGTNDYIDIPGLASTDFGDAFTISMWVNKSTNAASQVIIAKHNTTGTLEWQFNSHTTGGANWNPIFYVGAGYGYAGEVLEPNTWYHIAWVYDGTEATNADRLRLFVDGVQTTLNFEVSTIPASVPAAVSNVSVGATENATAFYDGLVDEIRLWSNVKTDFSDRFANIDLSASQPNLVAYYPLDENAGSNTVDRTVDINDGILTGFDFSPGSDWVTSTLTDGIVTNTNDSGTGSFREAINYANANPGTTITFNIPGGGPYNIGLSTALPDITAAGTIIDGVSQPGWTFGDVNNMVTIDGSLVPANSSGIVVNEVANFEIYGMIITGFTGLESHAAIELTGDGADNAIIGAPGIGNIIHGGGTSGIYITNADFTTIQDNWIGTLNGTTASGNNHHGISVVGTVDNLTIGGNTGSNEGNVISGAGNGRYGILSTAIGTNMVIQGNMIGTNEFGTGSILNEGGGINLGGATTFVIGGPTAGEENVISGNNSDANAVGVRIGTAPMGSIENNIIGLAADGTSALGNGGAGIILNTTSSGVTVAGNIISSNGGEAITTLTGFNNVDIINNTIGFDQLLTNPRPNAAGIVIGNGGATNNRIGYRNNPNIIANNTGAAIDLNSTSTGITFVTNEIYDNGSGIVLTTGTNGDIAAPNINAQSATNVSGSGPEGATIHLYLGDGTGQGQTFLDSATVSGGVWNIGGLSLTLGDEVVATTTDYGAGLGTSTFSTPATLTAPIAPTNLIAYATSASEITLEWTDNATNETGYLIERADDFGFTTNIMTVLASEPADTDSVGFSVGTDQPYFYRVTATNGAEDITSESNVEFATTEAFPGYALTLNGTTDNVTMGSALDLQLTGALTYEFWINTTAASGFVVGRRNSNGAAGIASNVEILGDGRFQLVINDGTTVSQTVQSVTSINDGNWHHVAVTYQPATYMRVYVDGVQDAENTSGIFSNLNPASLPFNLGYSSPASANFLNGTLDEVRVWDIAKTDFSDRFTALMGDEPNLMGYYSFDENGGATIVDKSGGISDGSFVGSPSFVASDFTNGIVTNTNDAGAGSLRDAILYANANPGTTITFNIGEVAPWTINLGSALPQITAANTIIDGTTQPGWTFGDPNAMVQINGSSIGSNANGINIDATNAEIYGLIITGFSGNSLNGNIYLASDAADYAVIGGSNMGNIIHGSGGNGIYIVHGDSAVIRGNRIGTLDGSTASAIGDHGISTTGEIDDLIIGGDFFTGEGNTISGSGASRYGMNLFGSGGGTGLSNVTIVGNRIGTNDAADAAIPNGLGGINILGTISAVEIGGPSPSDLNIISGNGDHGIIIQAGNTFDIDGNYIGLQSDGSSALGNAGSGMRINSAALNVNVGTNSQNIISENVEHGILFNGNNSQNVALGTLNIFSCNGSGGIGYSSAPLTPSITISDITSTEATVSTAAAESSAVFIYLADDGCNNDQGLAFIGGGIVSGGQAVISSAFVSGSNYVALVSDVNGYSEFSPPFTYIAPYPDAEGAGEALTFDGTDDLVDISTLDVSGANELTVEAWIKPAFIPGGPGNQYMTIIGKGSYGAVGNTSFALYLFGSDGSPFSELVARIDNGSNVEEARFDANNLFLDEWAHVALSWNAGNSVNLYVNGELVDSSSPIAGPLNTVGDNIMIGSSPHGGELLFEGEIDEVKIWDIARTDDAIRQDLARKVTNTHPDFANLLAYYRMDDSGDAANLVDFNGVHNGTINGGSSYTLSGAHIGDESIYEYIYTAGSGRKLGSFQVDNLGTPNLPLHIYRIDQTPAVNTVSGFDNIDRPAYYGVFAPGQTYDVLDSTFMLTGDRRLLFREDGAQPSWSLISGVLNNDLESFEIYGYNQFDFGQYVTAIDQNPYPTPADAGHAMSFDGVDDEIIMTGGDTYDFIQTSANFSFEFWLKINDLAQTDQVIASTGFSTTHNGFFINYANTGYNAQSIRIAILRGAGGQYVIDANTVANYIDDTNWHHYAVVGDGVNLYIYKDGVQTNLGAIGTLSASTATNNFALGTYDGQPGSILDGELDEVRVWDIALDETTIRDHMIGRIDADFQDLSSLVAYYRFDENSGSTAEDIAGTNNGTITGATPVVSGAPQGFGSLYAYGASPGKLNTGQFMEDMDVFYDDATGGIHAYVVGGNPNQLQADGFNNLDQGKYYGVFAPSGQNVDLRVDYNSGIDLNRRIVFRDDATDNAAVGGWERLSGLLNTDNAQDSIYAYNVSQGEFSTATLNPASSYPILGDTDPGTALDFDGTDDQVNLGNISSLSQTDSFTIEGWFNQTILDETRGMFIMRTDASNQIRARTWSDGNIYVYLHNAGTFNASFDYSAFVTAGQWFHFAMVFDGSGVTNSDRMKVYIDGVEVSLTYNGTVPTSTPDLSSADFLVSENVDLDSDYWLGQMDEFRIWNAAISAGDISAFANTTDISAHPNYADMLAYYKFDDGTGSTILEDVFANNDGTLTNMDENTDWVASGALANAPEQNALNFDGANDQVTVNDDANLDFGTNPFTVEFWVNPSSLPASNNLGLISKTSTFESVPGWTIVINTFADPGIQVGITNGPYDGTGNTVWRGLEQDRWYHVAMVRGTSDLKLYIDGVLRNTETNAAVLADVSNAENMLIGDASWGSSLFEGAMDEIRIWNIERTQVDIQSDIHSNLIGNEAGLVAYYDFNQGIPSGTNTGETTLTDKTVNGLDGTLANFGLTGGTSNWIASTAQDGIPNEAEDLFITETSPTQIDLSWTDQSFDETNFAIFRSDGNNSSYTEIATVGFDVTSFSDNTVTADNNYFYQVVARNGNGDSAPSKEKAAATFNHPGNALTFDGVDDFVGFGDNMNDVFAGADKTFSLEAWIKVNQLDESGVILSKLAVACGETQHQFVWRLTSVNTIQFAFYGDLLANTSRLINGSTVLNDTDWYHVAVTYDGSIDTDPLDRVKIYINGQEDAINVGTTNGSFPYDIPTGSAHLGLGSFLDSSGNQCGTTQLFDGLMDEVRIWDDVRTETEIQTTINNSLVGNEAGLVAYYKFDQSDATAISLPDRSIGQNEGILSGFGGAAAWSPSGALYTPSQENALNFDGTDDHVAFTRSQFVSGLTYEAWINTTSTANTSNYNGNPALTVIGDNDVSVIGAFGVHDGRIRYTHWNGSDFDLIDGNAIVNDGLWHHIAVSHENGTNEVKIYVDGVLDVTTTSSTYNTGMSANHIGSGYLDGTGNDDFFDGSIDEVRIWDSIVSGDDIRGYYLSTDLTGHSSSGNLVLHYTMDQGDAGNDNSGITTVIDQSGGLDGTLNGFTLSGPTSNFVTSTAFDQSGVTAPTLQASNISVSNVTETTADVSWTNGDGARRVVAVAAGSGNAFPGINDQVYYIPDAFTLGDNIDGPWFTVYSGFENSTTITGLSAGTDYEVAVIEANGPAFQELYNSNSAVDNPVGFSTQSSSPPVLSDLILNPQVTEVDVDITVDVESDLYYVISTSDTPPSESQVIGGFDGDGNAGFNVGNFGNITGTSNFNLGDPDFTGPDLIPSTTYYIFWVAQNGSGTSTVLDGTFTTLVQPNVNFVTQSLTAGTVEPGTIDNLVYAFSLTADMESTFEGVVVEFDNAVFDPATDLEGALPVTIWSNSTGNFEDTKTNIGSYGFGGDIDGRTLTAFESGLLSSGTTLPAGSPVYFYVTVDVAAGATDGNQIQVIDGDVANDVGVGDAAVTGSFDAGESFSIQIAEPDATFQTITVAGGNLTAGTTDNLVYKFSIAASGGNITKEGMIVAIGGDAVDADFSTDGWKLYESVNTDVADHLTADLIGTTNIGDVAPDSVGFAMPGDIMDGDTHYYYLAVDIDIAANVDNTFNVVLWAGDPTETVGLADPKNKIDGGFVDGETFTIQSDDTTEPTVTISSTASDPTNASSFVVDIVFDEDVTGFEIGDITVGNGTSGNFVTTDAATYSIEVTPTSDGAVTVDIAAGVAQDLAGNDNIAATQFSITFDSVQPTVTLSSSEGDPTNTSPIVIDVAFSEVVTDFELSDVTVSNGTAGNLVDVDGENYTVDITPTADGIVTLDVPEAAVLDAAGNLNVASTQFTINYSTTGPDITLDQDGLTVNDTNLSGTIENTTDVIQLSLDDGTTLSPVSNEGDGTWSYDLGSDPNFDGDGVYTIYLDAVDVLGNQTIASSGTVTIDQTAPNVEVDVYGTSITSPQVTGTIDDDGATLEVTVAGNSYTGTNNGDGTWVLAAGMISPALSDGTYDVEVTATDAIGNVGTDDTIDELIISQTVIALQASNITSTSFRANWSEGLDVETYQLDVSTTADFSTFVTGFENFETPSSNTTIANLDFSQNYYYRVRVVNTASEVSDNSNTITANTTVDLPTIADSLALTQIYATINSQGLNWDTERLRNWDGVTLDASKTRVSEVALSGTQSSGDMPNPFTGDALTNGGLSAMTAMDVSDNQLTGLMDFTGTSLSTLFVNMNNLQFDDLEPLTAQGITNLDYSDQARINYNQTTDGSPIEVRHLNDYVLSIGVDGAGIGGSNNTYTWYRNDEVIATSAAFGISNAEAVIVDIDYDNMGVFRTEVTSTLVPNLTIEVEPQTVWAVADVVMTLSDGSGNLIAGEVFDAALMETIRGASGYDTLERAIDVSSEFVFEDVVLGDYLCGVEPESFENYIPTYFGNDIEWGNAETITLRADATLDIVVEAVPGPTTGDGNLDIVIEEDFGDESSRIDARRRAAKRKCGLRRKRSGGRTGQDDDEFELIAYGETDENGEFQFGFLPAGTYRFFVEYPGIPLDESSEVEFEVGEAGISDTDFKLEAFATEDGIQISIDAVLGVILEYFKDLQIYPNPSSEYVNIRYRHLKSEDVTAELIDLSGNRKWSQELSNGYNGEIHIDVSNFNEGVYLLRFYDNESRNENVVTYRIMVRK